MIKKNGLTLIEMLVVIAVLSIVGVLILTIFTSTLKGSNKSQIISTIKQNGQAVLENMDKTIRNADNVVCSSEDTSDPAKSILVVVKNGVYTRYHFKPGSDLTKNNYIEIDNPVIQQDPTTCKNETDAQLKNRVCEVNAGDNWPQPSPSLSAGLRAPTSSCPLPSSVPLLPVPLTDNNPQTGVSVALIDSSSSFFTISPSAGSKDIVTVQFSLGPGKQAPASITGQIDPVAFQTSIQLR